MSFKFGSGKSPLFYLKKFSQQLMLTVLLAMIASGCENDPDRIGIGLMPGTEKLFLMASDTTTVLVHSVYSDSIKTDETTKSMLGSYLDPVFGLNTVSIATQVRLSTVSLDFGENPVLDSIVLSMSYTIHSSSGHLPMYYYGDTTTQQTIKVFELDESLVYDTSYYSSTSVALKSAELANLSTYFRPRDSVMVDTVLMKPQLRIRLSDEFGNSILNAPAEAKESVQGFLDFMKGLYIRPEPVTIGGAIVFFDLLDNQSRLNLYYKNAAGDAKTYIFFINAACARFMNFEHDYSLGDPDMFAQLEGNTALGAERLYLQSLGGIDARISFPFVRDWFKDQKIVINEAKLVFYNIDTGSVYKPPYELFFFSYGEDGKLGFLDDQYEGATYFGGQYDKRSGSYFFRITEHLQQVIQGNKENTAFTMGISGASLSPNRVVFPGTNPSDENLSGMRIKLQLKYTKLLN